jgi:hypothetical protein
MIQANGGRPPAVSQIRQAQPETAQVAHPNVKIAPPVQSAPQQNAQGNRQIPPQGNPNRPASADNANRQQNAQSNKPPVLPANPPNGPNTVKSPRTWEAQGSSTDHGRAPQGAGSSNDKPGNASPNPGNPREYNDRPPAVRPGNSNNSNNVNPQLDQKHQQQLEQLRAKQDQERQKVEQQQIQQRQQLAQKNADEQRQQQLNQQH